MRTIEEIKKSIANTEKKLAEGKFLPKDDYCDLLLHRNHEVVNLRLAYIEGISTERLAEICEAEKDGRLVVLPCKVGTPVWSTMFRKIISDDNGKFIREEPTSNWPFDTDMISDWGECWFMTREEAEAALEKEFSDQ